MTKYSTELSEVNVQNRGIAHLLTITKAIDTTSISLYGYAAGGETYPAFCSQKN